MSSATSPGKTPRRTTQALDGLAAGCFALFVALLLLGYFGMIPSLPYTALAAAALVMALGCLLWANLIVRRNEA